MCWSGEASAALAYFSLMELLQAYTYTVIDQCMDPRNQIATFLGYMHIAFQPYFVNAVAMHFIPDSLRQRIAPAVYTLCTAAAVVFMMRIYPFDWITYCFDRNYTMTFFTSAKFTMPFCGELICSTSGDWHIAWAIPANGNVLMGNVYGYAAFLLPLLYGSWKMTLYHFLSGPLLAYMTTNDMNEWAAVWCLYSIGLLLLMIKTPIRQYLYVKSWYGLPLPKFLRAPSQV